MGYETEIKARSKMEKLQEALWRTVHKSKRKSPKEIAGDLGISLNYLYRSVLPDTGGSGCNFPLKKLVPLMASTKDYSVLKVIASECGHLITRPPRTARNRMEKAEMMLMFQKECLNTIEKLLNHSSHDDITVINGSITRLMEYSEGVRKRIKQDNGQMEIILEEV